MKEWRNEGMKEWRNEGMKEWRNEGMKEWRNEGMKEWRNEGMKEWRNEGMKEWRNNRMKKKKEWNQSIPRITPPPILNFSRLFSKERCLLMESHSLRLQLPLIAPSARSADAEIWSLHVYITDTIRTGIPQRKSKEPFLVKLTFLWHRSGSAVTLLK